CRNMAFLTFGTGLGAGLIIDGKLYSGTNDNAGELGHIRLAEFGPVGYGKKGSFEGFASGGGVAQIGKTFVMEAIQNNKKVSWCAPDKVNEITAKQIAEAAAAGDEMAIEIYHTSARYLGKGLSIVIDILNPELIVIGSVYARNEKLFYDEMMKVIREEALAGAVAVCKVVPAALGEAIGDYASLSIAANLLEMQQ
ncbi:MAG: ROK family protein, partial [Bacteroidales bacterium]|nr:ROK family protein [Bacteroidales bacterium]